jgi:hypothetical protein
VNERKRLVWLAVGVAVALVAGVWLALRTSPERTGTLAGGRVVTLEAVTYGTEHRFVHGPALARVLAPILPPNWRKRLGVEVITRQTDQPSLRVWVKWRGGDANQRELVDASVFDEYGIESEPVRSDTTLYITEPPRGAIRSWQFLNWPRRDRIVVLRLYARGNAYDPLRLAEFRFKNPAGRSYPEWKAPVLPSQENDGGWEFSLTRLTAGEAVPDRLKPQRGWIAPWNRAAFSVSRDGQASDSWIVPSLTLRDATGNFIAADAVSTNIGGRLEAGFSAALWASENTWRLNVEFSRRRDFAPEEMVSANAVPIPEPGGQTPVNTQWGVQGATLSLKTIERARPQIGGFRGINPNTEVRLVLIPAEAKRLTLVKAVDDQGRDIPHLRGYTNPPGSYSFRLEVPREARTVDLTFAVHESRFVEFLAKPGHAGTNAAVTHR